LTGHKWGGLGWPSGTHRIVLFHAVKQGQTGDIDFRWDSNLGQIFIELKLLGEQLAVKQEEKSHFAHHGLFSQTVDDQVDVGRLQRDIFIKSSVTKFNPAVAVGDTNLIAIDVSELQLRTVDKCDCVHAVCGATGARGMFHEAMIRPEVVGALEPARELTPEEAEWVKRFHLEKAPEPHPRSYIHGVIFLFRNPKERAALDYELSCCIVWNVSLINKDMASAIESAVHKVIPKFHPEQVAPKSQLPDF
jgi:hypothetical protein